MLRARVGFIRMALELCFLLALWVGGLSVLTASGQDATTSEWDTSCAEPAELRLSLKACLQKALANSPELEADRYHLEGLEWSAASTLGDFDPVFFGRLRFIESRTKQASFMETGTPLQITDERSLRVGMRKKWDLGTETEVILELNKRRNNAFFNINEFLLQLMGQMGGVQAKSSLTVKLTQPLLRDFGFEVNNAPYREARARLRVAMQEHAQRAVDVLAEVEGAYWDLYFAYRDKQDKGLILDFAEELLRLAQEKRDLGLTDEGPVLEAEANLASRREAWIQTLGELREAMDRLAQGVYPLDGPFPWDLRIIPTDEPRLDITIPEAEELLRRALAVRPDYLKARAEVERARISYGASRSKTLPRLDLKGSWKIQNGLDETVNQAMDDMFTLDSRELDLRVEFEYPIGNRKAVAEHRQRRAELQEALIRFRLAERDVIVEVCGTTRDMENALESVRAAGASREYAEETLLREQERLRLGLSTMQSVVGYERDLVEAQASELDSLREYVRAGTELHKSIGALGQ